MPKKKEKLTVLSERFIKMTLHDIEISIFKGNKGVENSFDIISRYLTNNKHKLDNVKISAINYQVRLAKEKASKISTQFINQVSINSRYRGYIGSVVESGKLMSVSGSATKVLEIAVNDSNKRIINAKEPATKRNRTYEKNEVVKFFHNNYNSLVALFELYNAFHDIKQEINR